MIKWLPTAKITTDPIHKNFLKKAYMNAAIQSKDPSTQNGSILIPEKNDQEIFAANHFPQGVEETLERWQRPQKYDYVCHAERCAIFNAARRGISTYNATLYCTWYACSDCGRAIIQSGIKRVVGHKAMFDLTPERWRDTIIKAFEMMNEAFVECIIYDGKIFDNNEVALRFNGEIWRP